MHKIKRPTILGSQRDQTGRPRSGGTPVRWKAELMGFADGVSVWSEGKREVGVTPRLLA